jgi:hypothetical protein
MTGDGIRLIDKYWQCQRSYETGKNATPVGGKLILGRPDRRRITARVTPIKRIGIEINEIRWNGICRSFGIFPT